jgi:hypothetical protein
MSAPPSINPLQAATNAFSAFTDAGLSVCCSATQTFVESAHDGSFVVWRDCFVRVLYGD